MSDKLPEAGASIEHLDGEHAPAAVPEDQEPPGVDAARTRELRPSAPQERAVAVPPDLNAPELDLAGGGADDEGLPGADFRGKLVGDALKRKSKMSRSRVRAVATHASETSARTRESQVNGSSTLGCLAMAAAPPTDDAIGRRPPVDERGEGLLRRGAAYVGRSEVESEVCFFSPLVSSLDEYKYVLLKFFFNFVCTF